MARIPRFRPGLLALLAVGCGVALVAIYVFAPGGPGNCGACGAARAVPISSVFGFGAPSHGGTSSHHWWNFTVLWVNFTVPLSHLDLAVENAAGISAATGADWNVSVLQPPGSTLRDTYNWIGDAAGWTNGGSTPLVTGTVFVLYTGKDDVSGDRFALAGNSGDLSGSLTQVIF